LAFSVAATAQQFILYTENFDGATTFSLNSSGPGGPSGSNKWIINANYTGTPSYVNTLPEDSTVSGTIGGAPYSNYLHIHDEPVRLGGGVSNANYNGSAASDNFAFVSDGFCTKGMKDVIFTFFYLCEGSPTAYGEVYYSIDGGPWVGMGTHYNNQHRWKYESITDSVWNNQTEVRVGFRWVNNADAITTSSSWALDEFVAVGTVDTSSGGVHMSVPTIFGDSVCQNAYMFFNWNLTDSLCFGEYRIELSNASGSFSGTPTSLGTYYIGTNDTFGTMAALIPATTPPGPCYRIRITRINPAPLITSSVSNCIRVVDCANSITTLTPIVLTDVDTCCVQSAIDVPFYSHDVFLPGNVYIAEISDSAGSFAHAQTVGRLPSTTTFDPFLGSPPGTVSGLIPRVPAGCGYYIRVRGTNPPTTGSVYGPFCLKHCDVTTNLTVDMNFCVGDTPGTGVCDSIEYDIHSFDSLRHYFPGNNFRLQIINKKTFAIVNDGTFFFHYDTTSRKLVICIPYLDSLRLRGLDAGGYYARFVADSSSDTDNINGTIIRFTIGAPASMPPTIVTTDTVGCNVGVMEFFIDPYNPNSQYEWVCSGINSGTPFIWPYNPLRVDFTGAAVNDYVFYVREINYGCYGPYSAPKHIYIISTPPVVISGPSDICLGDTVCFDVPFVKSTYYEWTVVGGKIVDASNNQMCVVFDSLGTHNIHVYALNKCGTSTNDKSVNVNKLLDANVGNDTTICKGDTLKLTAHNDGVNKSITTIFNGASSTKGNMFDVKALYDATIVNFDANFQGTAAVDVAIYFKNGSYVGSENTPADWNLLASYPGLIPAGSGLPTRIPVDVYQDLIAGNTYGFYICVSNTRNMLTTSGTLAGTVYKDDGVHQVLVGSKNVYPFGAFLTPYVWNGRINYKTKGVLKYLWNTGDTTESIRISPPAMNHYEVRIYDTSGCGTNAGLNVAVNNPPIVDAGPDTAICQDQPYTMQAVTTGTNINWTPSTGLSSSSILNPVVNISTPTAYILINQDPGTNCKGYDTVKLSLKDCQDPLKVPEAFTPNGDGVNDHFTVFGDGMKTYLINIFNRWGELVYHSEDPSELGDLNRGWDGFYKGKVQEIGVYAYYIKGTDRDNIVREKKGNITLVK